MKKNVQFEKKIDFPTMIGEISAISLEHTLKFVDESNIEGDFIVSGKYKLTEASRLEEDFLYHIPVEIALTEKIDLNTSKVEIRDFTYDMENDDAIICHINLQIEGLELLEENDSLEERECDGDIEIEKETQIPIVDAKEKTIEEMDIEKIEEKSKKIENDNPLLFNINDENDTYGTFVIYIVRQNESVREIIERYHTTLEEVEKYNDLNHVNIGSKLIIPLLHD